MALTSQDRRKRTEKLKARIREEEDRLTNHQGYVTIVCTACGREIAVHTTSPELYTEQIREKYIGLCCKGSDGVKPKEEFVMKAKKVTRTVAKKAPAETKEGTKAKKSNGTKGLVTKTWIEVLLSGLGSDEAVAQEMRRRLPERAKYTPEDAKNVRMMYNRGKLRCQTEPPAKKIVFVKVTQTTTREV